MQWNEELKIEEKILQDNRDYKGLMKLYNGFLNKAGLKDHGIHLLPPMIYCYLKIGNIKESDRLLKIFENISIEMDEDSKYRIKVLLHLAKTQENDMVSSDMLTKTIKNWIGNPEFSKEVFWVIFDYEDIIGSSKPFNSERRKVRNHHFTDSLINQIFSVMCSPYSECYYYNRELNIVQHKVEDYLVDTFAEDQEKVNLDLRMKILEGQQEDYLIDEIHFQIPKLHYHIFIGYLQMENEGSSTSLYLNMFLDFYEQRLLQKYEGMLDDIQDILFTNNVRGEFLSELEAQFNGWGVRLNSIYDTINEAPLEFALGWLSDINN